MTIQAIMKDKNISVYQLAKISGVPYATVNDICSGKASLGKCQADTVYKLSKVLGVSMEDLLKPNVQKRPGFENFKSHIGHQLKAQGDLQFIVTTLQNNDIRLYFDMKWYPESLYLLAMLDYVSRINDVPIASEYDDLRHYRLNETIYPSSLIAMAAVSGNNDVLKEAKRDSIPEFMRFNIVESDIRDVV